MDYNIDPLFACPIYRSRVDIDFTDELAALERLDYIQPPRPQKLNNHYITDDDKLHLRPEFARCRQIFQEHLDQYVNDILCCTQSFYISHIWSTTIYNGGSHYRHNHPNAILSGTMYLKSDADNDSGKINFWGKPSYLNDFNFLYNYHNYNIFNSNVWSYPVATGDIFLFPAHVDHSVDVWFGDDKRVVMGFNAFAKGVFENEEYAADLYIN